MNMAAAHMAAHADFWEKSKAKGYETQADAFETTRNAAALKAGSFVWGIMDNRKCDHEDFRRVVRHLVMVKADGYEPEPRLCKIIRIEDVVDIESNAAGVLRGWKPHGNEGGSGSDDVTEEEIGKLWQNWSTLTDEQKRTFYTLAVLVRDTNGRYFLIDPEGHDYPRYAILPKTWEQMYAATVDEVRAELKAEEKAKAEKEAADRAAYNARCKKWEGMMEELPADLKDKEYLKEYRKIGKRNVIRMAKAAFPQVRFSVSYVGSWMEGYVLRWKNGPTVDEVRKSGDFDLFATWWDTIEMGCADTKTAQFSDFSDRFGGVGNGVKFKRVE